jgi:hypothetical protein
MYRALTLNDGHDGTLLDGARPLETVSVDTTKQLGLQVHRIEGVGGLIVVGFDLGWWRDSIVSIVCLYSHVLRISPPTEHTH